MIYTPIYVDLYFINGKYDIMALKRMKCNCYTMCASAGHNVIRRFNPDMADIRRSVWLQVTYIIHMRKEDSC